MSKRKYFKCPNCGCTSYTEYNDNLRNGVIAGAVGAFLLGPVGLLAAGLAGGSQGRKSNKCGKKVAYELSAESKKARGQLASNLTKTGVNQFKAGYNAAKNDYDD